MNIVAIIQARLGSSRLPMKAMLTLGDQPVIDWVTGRIAKSSLLSGFVVAIPNTPLDEVLERHLGRKNIPVWKGSENDVLRRFTEAAQHYEADLIVRVCADNPFIWWEAIDRLIEFYLASHSDYAWNHIPRNNLWPDGLGAEIISRNLLEELDRKAKLPSQREHCFNYIWDNAPFYRMATFDPQERALARPEIRLDIDSAEDYQKLAKLEITKDMDAEEIIKAWDRYYP